MATFGNLDPSVLSAIQSAANSFAQQSGAYDWTSLLGSYQNPGTPIAPGTATLPAEEAAGLMTNAPFAGDLTAQMQQATGYTNPYINEMGNLGNAYSGPQETLQGTEANQAASGWITPPGTPPPGAVRFGQTGDGVWAWMDAGDHVIGPTYATQQGGPTMSNQQAFANEFGTLGAFGANANGTQAGQQPSGYGTGGGGVYGNSSAPVTLAAQTLYGNSGGAAGGGAATQQAKQEAGNFIQNATAGSFANPFTAQAKLQGLANAGSLGGILGNNLAAASGTPLWELQNTPNLTNVQLGTDLANAQVGKPMSSLTQNFLSQMLGAGGAGQTAQSSGARQLNPDGTPAASGGMNPPDGGTTVIGGTHYHLVGSANPLLAQNPGAATPIQEFNKLDPSLQQSYLDLEQQMPNGQTSQDFLSQMKNAAPSATFKPAAFATSGI